MITTSAGLAYTAGVTLNGTVPNSGTYLEFAIPSDVPPGVRMTWTSGSDVVNVPMTISGSTYTSGVTGITLEGPAANQTGTVAVNGYQRQGWISLNEQQGAGERLVLDNSFFTDLLGDLPDYYEFAIGLKGDSWANTQKTSGSNFAVSGIFKGDAYLSVRRTTSNNIYIKAYANGTASNQMLVNTAGLHQTVCAFIDVTSSGNNIRIGFGRNGDASVTAGDESTVAYSDWASYKVQTGAQGYGISNLDVMVQLYNTWSGGNFDADDVDWTAITEVSVPAPAPTSLTDWAKALDFSGSNEHAAVVSQTSSSCPLRMGDLGSIVSSATAGNTSSDSLARPWAAACVFSADGNNSNQHIWNMGEGAGSNDDNIYLRLSSSRQLFFGWGRTGALNELYIGTITANRYYGIYVGHNGTRLSGANATNINLSNCFDVRLMSAGDSFASISDQGTAAEWGNTGYSTVGGRMDRTVTGDFTIGGRGGNRNFHGKVASMVVTTLERNVAMPTDAEIKLMVTDPVKWVTDHRVGQAYRLPGNSGTTANFSTTTHLAYWATQVWLMGDGSTDSFANGIRNYVRTNDQNYTKLQLNSMQSNDIQNVTIPGLS